MTQKQQIQHIINNIRNELDYIEQIIVHRKQAPWSYTEGYSTGKNQAWIDKQFNHAYIEDREHCINDHVQSYNCTDDFGQGIRDGYNSVMNEENDHD